MAENNARFYFSFDSVCCFRRVRCKLCRNGREHGRFQPVPVSGAGNHRQRQRHPREHPRDELVRPEWESRSPLRSLHGDIRHLRPIAGPVAQRGAWERPESPHGGHQRAHERVSRNVLSPERQLQVSVRLDNHPGANSKLIPMFSSMTLHRTGARVFACGLHHPALEEFHVQRRGVRLCGGNHGSFWSRHI